jgi:hypothetical protein
VFLNQILDGGVELRVVSGECGVREIIHDNVEIDAVAFDEPFALRAVDADFSGRGDSLISQDEFLTRLWYYTVTACSALCRTPRTRCKKPCLESMTVVWFPASSETFQ